MAIYNPGFLAGVFLIPRSFKGVKTLPMILILIPNSIKIGPELFSQGLYY